MKRFSFSVRTGIVGLSAATLALLSPVAFSSYDGIRVESTPVTVTAAEEQIFWRSLLKSDNTTSVTFLPLPETTLKRLQEENTPGSSGKAQAKYLKIGVNRNADTETDTPSFALNWEYLGDGYAARWAITSPEAFAMRVALQLSALPDDAELRFSGSDAPENIVALVTGKEANALRNDGNVYWTPVTDGETQNIEIFLPSTANTEDVRIRLNAISHLFTSSQEGYQADRLFKASGSCNVNVVCKNSLGASYQNTVKAVARMVFTIPDGSALCTGTLLSNTSSNQTPYFWSAAHCISTQAVANTLNTNWFYEASSCNGSSAGSNHRQLSGGADLLHASTASDTLLLRLKNTPPSGAVLAGWDSTAFSSGNVTAIHHPAGDIKKVSIGKGEGRNCNGYLGMPGVNQSLFSMVSWSEATTEGGSSGSGLFTVSDGHYYLRGGLAGGLASCENSGRPVNAGNYDCYSGLNHVWNDIRQWLNPSSDGGPTPSGNRTGQWIKTNPENEDAWGLSVLMNFPGNPRYLFAPWYTYDRSGNASWFIFQGDTWTDANTFTATVQRFSGPTWGVFPYDNSRVKYTNVGTAKLTFTSDTRARFEYNVDGSSRTIDLRKLD